MSGSDLRSANFSSALLGGVNISIVDDIKTNLSNANFSKTNLHGADIRKALCLSTDFSDANLSGVNLFGADIKGANFFNADLTWARIRNKADLEKAASLEGANLNGIIYLDEQPPEA